MQISNTTLLFLVAVLVGVAAWIAVGKNESPPPFATDSEGTGARPVIPDITRRGGTELTFDPTAPITVRFKGRAPERVTLRCGRFSAQERVRGGSVSFSPVPPDGCALNLADGGRPFSPAFPGDRLTCSRDGDRTLCTGGVAQRQAGHVTVRAGATGELVVDGDPKGTLPLENLRLTPGRHQLLLDLGEDKTVQWSLVVGAEESVDIYFPVDGTPAPVPDPEVDI